jgi:hypothetical protein
MELLDFSQYSFGIAVIQFVVAGIMFFVTNWLGGQTPVDRGYVTLSLIAADDTMPAFNFVFKTLTPLVQYILFIALFQSVTPLAFLLANSYMIIVYYWLIRGLYYVLRGAFYLANWSVFMIYVIVSVGAAMWIYVFVDGLGSILPSKATLRDQMWILIAIFVYQVLNGQQFNRTGTEDRKHRYALRKYHAFTKKYSEVVDANSEYVVDADLLYAIMIVENYNRPPLVRFVENLKFRITRKRMSLGIMQVQTDKIIDDKESIKQAAEIIAQVRENYIQDRKEKDSMGLLCQYLYSVAEKYNGGNWEYVCEVREIFEIINSLHIQDTTEVEFVDALEYKVPKWRKEKKK